jgi:hypothetical protein
LEDDLRSKKHSDVRADVTSLPVEQLVEEFLADPETKAKRYYDDLVAASRMVGL